MTVTSLAQRLEASLERKIKPAYVMPLLLSAVFCGLALFPYRVNQLIW
jgi:hypothetical protein